MNFLSLLLFCGTFVFSTTSSISQTDHWMFWKETYNKVYTSEEEEIYRYGVWKSNAELVESHNNRVDAGFQMELNMFGDQIFRSEHPRRRSYPHNSTSDVFTKLDNSIKDVPDSFDWRTKGAVNPVMNQGQMGNAYAYAVTETVESFHFIKTGKLVLLSELETVQCCVPSHLAPEDVFGCIHKIGGLCSEQSYPASNTSTACRSTMCQAVAQISGGENVKTGDEDMLKVAVYKNPVVALIDAGHSSFQLYRSGVYYEPSCSSVKLDHAVQVVGYGHEGDKDYWIVRNSWGSNWGMDGYILMSRNRNNNCGIATDAMYPV